MRLAGYGVTGYIAGSDFPLQLGPTGINSFGQKKVLGRLIGSTSRQRLGFGRRLLSPTLHSARNYIERNALWNRNPRMAPRKRSASVNRGTTKDRTPSPSPKRQIAAKHAATPSTPSPSPKSKSSQRSIKAAVPTTTAGGETHAPFEFGGPILGPVVLVFTLPLLVWWTAFHCSSTGWPSTGLAWPPSARLIPSWNDFRSSLDLSAFGVYCAWFALQVLLHLIIPGRVVSGTALADGTRLPYKINGEQRALLFSNPTYLTLRTAF